MTALTYSLLRILIATSMFGHGLVRLPKLNGFSQWMVGSFEKSMLPQSIVLPFSYFLPIAELVIGLLLILGLWTKQTAVAGALVMIALIFGSSMQENWEAIPSQLIHGAFFVALISFIEYNQFSIDKLLQRTK